MSPVTPYNSYTETQVKFHFRRCLKNKIINLKIVLVGITCSLCMDKRPNYQNVPGSVYKALEGSVSVHLSLMLQNFRVSILSERLLEVRIPTRRLGGTLTSWSSRFKMASLCINRNSCTLHTSQCCFCVIKLVVPTMLCPFSL